MVKIYVVRHCEAMGNLKKSFQGRSDSDISENGVRQLELLKERFRDINIDRVYSSPLIRARKTALAAVEGKDKTLIVDERFIELDLGELEGMAIDDIINEYPWFSDAWDIHPESFSTERGEAMQELYDRMWDGIQAVASDPENDGKTILVASHGAAIRNLICRVMFGDIKKLSYTPWSVNTAVSLLTFDENGVTLRYANDASHLPDDLIKYGRLLTVRKEQ